MAFCSFSNARTSIWRTRSRLTPYSPARVLERGRIILQPALGDDVLFAIGEILHGVAEQAHALGVFLGFGHVDLGADGVVVGQPVLPLAFAVASEGAS